jgi:SAM-dependent methyltransferase
MHASAHRTALQFFDVYASRLGAGTVVEIGSKQVSETQHTLRHHCPPHLDYLGLDLESGLNVDLVLSDPYILPLGDESVDVVLCTSVFEHSEFFWELFAQILRVLRPGGLLYVNAPSNGYVHRYPVDCWRFYPDSGVALAEWGRKQGYEVSLLESFITDEDRSENPLEIWNDFVAVFMKGSIADEKYPLRMMDLRNDYSNARQPNAADLLRPHLFPGRPPQGIANSESATESGATNVALYHIAYSEETWNSVPKGLIRLDNRSNERPDWAEYWPIRRFLQSEELDENAFYGFLSPRFMEKMSLPPEEILSFIAQLERDVDVAAFSPFFDHRALFINVFEHGEFFHPGLIDISRKILARVFPDLDIDSLVNTTDTAIFCNYFAAKPRFWRKWLEICEQIFNLAESEDDSLASELRRKMHYGKGPLSAKVFVIERIASLLLAISNDFKVAKFSKSTLSTAFQDHPFELLTMLETLKSQAGFASPNLRAAYVHIQGEILEKESARNIRRNIKSESLQYGIEYSPSRGYARWDEEQRFTTKDKAAKTNTQHGLGWLLRQIFK